jgi:hypothetical protein
MVVGVEFPKVAVVGFAFSQGDELGLVEFHQKVAKQKDDGTGIVTLIPILGGLGAQA